MHIKYWWGGQKERDHFEDQDVGGWIILQWIFREIGRGGMDWVNLPQDRNQWWALLNMVMNLRIP
jgi:hypothetical protein